MHLKLVHYVAVTDTILHMDRYALPVEDKEVYWWHSLREGVRCVKEMDTILHMDRYVVPVEEPAGHMP